MSAPETVGERIARARSVVPDLTAKELGKLAGISSLSHVGMIERGDVTKPSALIVVKIAAALGVSAEWLVSGSGKFDPEAVRSSIAKRRAADKRRAAS